MIRHTLAPALVFCLTLAASPLFADGLAFEAVAPEGLDAEAAEMVDALQAGMPAQLPAFEAQGFGAYGAIAVPMGVALKPEFLSSVANLDNRDAASAGVLEACLAQTGAECTVVGFLVPAGG